MLHQLLGSINAFHLLFFFMQQGLLDDDKFMNFLALPPTLKKKIVEVALQGTASDDEIQAVLVAVQWQ